MGVNNYLVIAFIIFYLGQELLSINRFSYLTGALIMRPTYILQEIVFIKKFKFSCYSAALEELNPEDLIINTKKEITINIFYCVSCVLLRLIILWLYLRIFS